MAATILATAYFRMTCIGNSDKHALTAQRTNRPTVYKDEQGRIQRTVTTDRNVKTTFREGGGRIIGTLMVR